MTIAQLATDVAPVVGQYGFAGMLAWAIIKRMDRLEHVMAGLSRALWMDLASRPYSDKVVKEIARKESARMEMDAERSKK